MEVYATVNSLVNFVGTIPLKRPPKSFKLSSKNSLSECCGICKVIKDNTGASKYIRMSWKSSFISVIQLKLWNSYIM